MPHIKKALSRLYALTVPLDEKLKKLASNSEMNPSEYLRQLVEIRYMEVFPERTAYGFRLQDDYQPT